MKRISHFTSYFEPVFLLRSIPPLPNGFPTTGQEAEQSPAVPQKGPVAEHSRWASVPECSLSGGLNDRQKQVDYVVALVELDAGASVVVVRALGELLERRTDQFVQVGGFAFESDAGIATAWKFACL